MAQENKELKEIEELKAKCNEYLDGWKRERADFINYKKAEAERAEDAAKYANERLMLGILPILDNFYLAEKHIQDTGFMQIKKQLEDLLKKEEIEGIETLGKPFDPAFMESVGEVSGVPDSAQAGAVAEEIQKGYTMRGKLLRPAKVKILE